MPSSVAPPAGQLVVPGAERVGCVVAVLRGDLDVALAPALREELFRLLRPGASRLVVDLSPAGSADVSGVAVLVGAGHRARLLGGWLRLASPAPEVARFLSVTGLIAHLATFPTVEDAITGRPDAGTADAPTGAGHVAFTRPAAARRQRTTHSVQPCSASHPHRRHGLTSWA
jgi:anti-anti-sigma factor